MTLFNTLMVINEGDYAKVPVVTVNGAKVFMVTVKGAQVLMVMMNGAK